MLGFLFITAGTQKVDMNQTIRELVTTLGSMVKSGENRELLEKVLVALDERYGLAYKIQREPGVKDILLQMMGRIYRAYGGFSTLGSLRILDIACGSNSSRAPSFVFVDTPFGERRIPISSVEGFTAQFEPWFCRILLELEADPVGIDLGDLAGEPFEHYSIDLSKSGVLDVFPERSFDGIQDSRLFGSPEFTDRFPNPADRLRIAEEIVRQEKRLLKPNGIIIHSDAANLIH
jgi:hypothetical protein